MHEIAYAIDGRRKMCYTDWTGKTRVAGNLCRTGGRMEIFMVNGLAIWHYPHRNDLENVRFFAENGFGGVSMHGRAMAKVGMNDELGEAFAALIREKKLALTAHSKLPLTHGEEDVAIFKRDIDAIAKWQKKYGLLAVLSFDVAQDVRDNVMPYIEYVLQYEQFDKVALEDFGVTPDERAQIEPLKGNGRFGYLLDLGHMNIRMHGINTEPINLFRNSPSEGAQTQAPGYEEFLYSFRSKEFPIFEIHLHNNDGVGDLHNFLESGTIDMHDIARVLKQIGFDGIVTIETVPRLFGYHYPESDEKILQTFTDWKECLKES